MLTCKTYEMPRDLTVALTLWRDAAEGSRLVAGATDLLPWAREGRGGDVEINTMIDLSRVSDLSSFSIENDRVRLGANIVWQDFLREAELVKNLPCMPYAAIWFADDQIRETATLAGNLVNASPAADGTPPVAAMNGTVELARLDGESIARRDVDIVDFIIGPGKTAMNDGEIVTAVTLDALPDYGGSFQKVGQRRSLVISAACATALVKLDASGEYFEDVRLAFGGVGPKPMRLTEIEDRLKGRPASAETIMDAALGSEQIVASRSRVEYRRVVVPGFVRAALEEAVARCPERSEPLKEAS